MQIEGLAVPPSPSAGPKDPDYAAARRIQVALFTELLRSGGFAEAFSTGSGTLDHFTGVMLDHIAQDLSRRDHSLADGIYRQLKARTSPDTP